MKLCDDLPGPYNGTCGCYFRTHRSINTRHDCSVAIVVNGFLKRLVEPGNILLDCRLLPLQSLQFCPKAVHLSNSGELLLCTLRLPRHGGKATGFCFINEPGSVARLLYTLVGRRQHLSDCINTSRHLNAARPRICEAIG